MTASAIELQINGFDHDNKRTIIQNKFCNNECGCNYEVKCNEQSFHLNITFFFNFNFFYDQCDFFLVLFYFFYFHTRYVCVAN